MKIVYIAFLFLTNQIFAQNLAIAAEYEQIINLTPNSQPKSNGVDVKLYHSNKKSFYVYNRIDNDSIKDDRVLSIKTQIDALNSKRVFKDRTGIGVYKSFDESIVISREIVAKKGHYYEEKLPIFNWSIVEENKIISGFKCQKAVTFYKGRQYEAWFTQVIPISDGPWKFHGLPGLILEVYDSEKKIQFLFKSYEILKESRNIAKPCIGIKVSDEKELRKIKQELDEELVRKLQSNIPKGEQIKVEIKEAEPIEKEEK